MLVQVLFLAIGLVCCASGAEGASMPSYIHLDWKLLCGNEKGLDGFCTLYDHLCSTAHAICPVIGALKWVGSACWDCNDTSNLHELVESQGLRFDWPNVCTDGCSFVEKVYPPLGQCCPLVCDLFSEGHRRHTPPREDGDECSKHIADITKKNGGVVINWDKACGKKTGDPICAKIPELCACSNLACGARDVWLQPEPVPQEEAAVGRSGSTRKCPTGYSDYGDTYCWKLVRGPATWRQAQYNCQKEGPHYGLASVDGAKMDDARHYMKAELGEFGSGRVWVGAIQIINSGSGGSWFWIKTGTYLPTTTNWAPNRPSHKPKEDCVQLYKEGDRYPWGFNDDEFDHKHMYMCEFYLE